MMVRTRIRCYGEEPSQSSSNIAYSNRRSRPKGKRQRVTSQRALVKRQQESKKSSVFTFDMSEKYVELLGVLKQHEKQYTKLLGEISSGHDRTIGKIRSKSFWKSFAKALCVDISFKYEKDMDIACQLFCDRLEREYKFFMNSHGPLILDVNGPTAETWRDLNRIFGVCTQSTSTRSSKSGGSTSNSRPGRVKMAEVVEAITNLAHNGHLKFEAVDSFREYVTETTTRAHVFMTGSTEYQKSVVDSFLGKSSV